MYFVYILECCNSDGNCKYYTGYTSNLRNRLWQHQSGRKGAKFTKYYANTEGASVKLGYFEIFDERGEAMKRENEIKSWPHSKKCTYCNEFQKRAFMLRVKNVKEEIGLL
jgi:putative endonuclease